MTYDPDLHHRRSIRLADYDYSQEGAYFVTVCTEGHLCLLAKVIDGEIRINDAGDMVQTAWDELPGHYPGVETDAFVVMPNHVHAIIVPAPGSGIVGAGPSLFYTSCPVEIRGVEGVQKRGRCPRTPGILRFGPEA